MIWKPELRYAVRSLIRTPLFTLATVVMLSLVIGANSAVMTLLDRVLVRPFPGVKQLDRLAYIDLHSPGREDWSLPLVFETFLAFRQHSNLAAGVGAWTGGRELAIQEGVGDVVSVPMTRFSYDLLPTLGLHVAAGRSFSAEEDSPGGPSAVILGYSLWKTRFAGNPAIVGQSIRVNGAERIVVGVLPPLRVPQFGEAALRGVILPLADAGRQGMGSGMVNIVARLTSGATLASLDQEVRRLHKDSETARNKNQGGFVARARSYRDRLSGAWRKSVLLQSAALALILLIGCANVAGMMLARGSERGRELAIRVALGANRKNIIAQLLMESSLLGMAGSLAGLWIGRLGQSLLGRLLPPHPALSLDAGLDGATVLLTLLVGVGTTLLFALLPALRLSRDAVAQGMSPDRFHCTSVGRSRLRKALIVGEVALSMSLLFATGLLVSSLVRLDASHPGFDPAGVLHVRLSYDRGNRDKLPSSGILLQRLAEIPGVKGVAHSNLPPTQVGDMVNGYRPAELAEGLERQASCNWVSPDYFRVHRIALREGRSFLPGEKGSVLVNEALARRFWPGGSALGHTLLTQATKEPVAIIGVIQDVKRKVAGEPVYDQIYFPTTSRFPSEFSVRVEGMPMTYLKQVEDAVRDVTPLVHVARAQALTEMVDEQNQDARVRRNLLAAYAATALLLTAAGLYGLLSYIMGRRRREIGIRIALGATRACVLRLVLAQGLGPVLLGMLAGIGGGVVFGEFLASELYDTAYADPVSLGASAAVLLIIAALACLVPALRSMRVQPEEALRVE